MTELILDTKASHARVHTFAEGLLARLAHDLELVCRDLSGSATRDAADRGSATLEVPIRGVDVVGVLGKDGRVDERALSPSDRQDVLEKMRGDVFQIASGAVRVEATLEGTRARLRIATPNGRSIERSVDVAIEARDDHVRVTGSFALSLSAIGSKPVKGPMGAFRVKDGLDVAFDVTFAPKR